jgi:alanine-glyoxylate transaminase/serine-glyoxylate transaminase/serine-pyruvate transaminase
MKGRKFMIPGPIEFEPDVLQAMGWLTSHVAPDFIEVFGKSLRANERSLKSPKGKFIVAGTGTLAMDMAAANLIEKEIMYWYFFRYFGKRFKDILDRYGANTTLQNFRRNCIP